MKVSINGSILSVERAGDTKVERALHGLTRSLISNMVTGVSQGYQKVLDIVGVGYKAQVTGDKIMITLGYSHPIEFMLPEGIKATVDPIDVSAAITLGKIIFQFSAEGLFKILPSSIISTPVF